MITSIIQTLFTAIVSMVFLRQVFRLWRSSDGGALRLEYSCVTIFSLAIAPHVLTYDLVLLLCPVVLLMNDSDHVRTAPLAFVVFIACQLTTVALVTGASLIPVVLLYVLWKCPNLNSELRLQRCDG